MIKKFIDKILGKQDKSESAPNREGGGHDAPEAFAEGASSRRIEYTAEQHGIDPTLVDDRAIKVVETLQDEGYEAYIVGGAVRDLLLGHRPKDFDVATNATPEQVKSLFRRAFIIGRRFRIVHVVFGRGREHEVIEVSTFRAYLDAADAEKVSGNEKTSKADLHGKSHVVDASGRLLRDNVWGPQHEDAARRDFTVNALYYDPLSEVVVDYHGGIEDVRRQVLRMIGDPLTRYREDPVRIIRAVRFAAKLGFEIEPKTRAPIEKAVRLLGNVPQSRMFDEMIKLLQTGHALASIEQMKKYGLDHGVFPLLDAVLFDQPPSPIRQDFIRMALEDTDRRVNEGKSVAPSFMLACMLWHEVVPLWENSRRAGEPLIPALQQAIDQTFDARIGDISGRGKLAADMRDIWMMQPRFEKRTGNGPASLVEQPRFRAGFDFLRLRADVGEVSDDLATWWEDYSLGSDDDRRALMDVAKEQMQQQRQPRSAASVRAASEVSDTQEAGDGATSAPARKRRRRRKPAAARQTDAS